jgi:hypothetical protein
MPTQVPTSARCLFGGPRLDHGTAADMDGMEMDRAVVDGTVPDLAVPDGAAMPHQVAGTAAGSRGVGYAYSACADRTGSTIAEHEPHQDATGRWPGFPGHRAHR